MYVSMYVLFCHVLYVFYVVYVNIYVYVSLHVCICLSMYIYASLYICVHTHFCLYKSYLVNCFSCRCLDCYLSVWHCYLGKYPSILCRNCKVEYNHLDKILYSDNKNQPR